MADFTRKWDKVKETVRKDGRLEDVAYEAWIKPLQIERVQGNNVIVYCKDSLHLNYLNRKYLGLIDNALKKEGLKGYKVKLMLSMEDEPVTTKRNKYVYFPAEEKKNKEQMQPKHLHKTESAVSSEFWKILYEKYNEISDEMRKWCDLYGYYLKVVDVEKMLAGWSDPIDEETDHMVEIERIVDVVADYFGTSSYDMLLNKHTKPYMVAMYLACEMTDYSLDDISAFFGCDTDTVLSKVRKVDDYIVNGDKFSWRLEELMKRISEMSV